MTLHFLFLLFYTCTVQSTTGGSSIGCDLLTLLLFSVAISTCSNYLCIGEALKRFVSHTPYLVHESSIAPHVTSSRVLLVVKSLYKKIQHKLYTQGRSQGGGSGGSAETPLQINDIHDYCYALEKLRADMYVLYTTPTFLCSFNRYT